MKLTIDFETRSELNHKAGSWIYSRHPSTEVLCVSWWDGVLEEGQWRNNFWRPPDRPLLPMRFFKLVNLADVVEAHNSFFEYCIWENVCCEKYGWWQYADIPFEKWRCSASKAAAMSIPRNLGDAGRALKLAVVKDEEHGRGAMQKLSKPRKPTKNDPRVWHDNEDDWDKMLAYNVNDVHSEVELSDAIPDLSNRELEVWRASERLNIRGVAVDVEGCKAAVRHAGEYARRLTAEFNTITGLDTAGQRAKFVVWLATQNVFVANTQADTLDELLDAQKVVGAARRAIEIVRTMGRSSIKKYRTTLAMADVDERVRGCFLYHGAGTGRWAGKGIQPQNYPRACPKNMDQVWHDIKTMELDELEMIYGDPLKLLSSALRGSIVAPPGRILRVGDYAQIEARMTFWLAGARKALEIFRRDEDMYCAMASTIYNRTITKRDELERFLGKQATLALGFGAGFVKFLVHCRNLGAPRFTRRQICELVPAGTRNALLTWILNDGWEMVKRYIPKATREDAEELVMTKFIVDRYRREYKDTVVALWKKLEDAARRALNNYGELITVPGCPVAYQFKKGFLNCRLPSGRIIRYCDPKVDGSEITYMTTEDGQWRRTKTYGGKLTENVVQAASRDVMSDAMLRLEQHEAYKDVVFTVHDEIGCECDVDKGSVEEFEKIMSQVPAWCNGLPVKVEAFETVRYRK